MGYCECGERLEQVIGGMPQCPVCSTFWTECPAPEQTADYYRELYNDNQHEE